MGTFTKKLVFTRNSKGFSLVELIVVMAISTMFMLLIGMTFQGSNEQLDVSQGKITVEEAVRGSLYRMALEIRESAVSRVTIANGGATLNFQIPQSISNDGVITWSNLITYQVDGTTRQLVRTLQGTPGATVLANDIDGVNFNAVGTPVTSYSFTVTARRNTINGRNLTVSGTNHAKPRNVDNSAGLPIPSPCFDPFNSLPSVCAPTVGA